jgi:hypothetical protein
VTAETSDLIPRGKRLLLFARIPFALAVALALAQGAGLFDGRDSAVLGAPESAAVASRFLAAVVVLLAAILPGAAILAYGVPKGLLFSIGSLVLYLSISAAAAHEAGVVLPLLAPVAAWYLSQILGIGWRPHARQDVRHFLRPDQRRVFLSYRRSLDEVTARMLKQELAARGFDVFLDVDNLGPSSSFDQRLLAEITGRSNFVLLLSPGSLERSHEPDDWIRRELEHALAIGRRVVPVTRAGFQLGDQDLLPPSLRSLPMHNAIEYTSTHHDAVIDRLVAFLSMPARSAA